ncbi:MAG: amino acid transporter [Acidobacteria bacterium]|nr:MAG: amino acid transporter [Acidobacteriota bacterium]
MATSTSSGAATQPATTELVKGLNLLDATTIVMGSMIGSGVFIVAAEIGREVGSPGLMLLTWVLTGLMTVIAAVTYGELAAMMPHAGGQYVYLRESLNPLFGFLYGWTLFLVIQTGTIAAVAVAFGKFLGVFFPWISAENILIDLGAYSVPAWGHTVHLTVSTQQLVALMSLMALAVINMFGLRTGAWVQNVFTTLKVGALMGLIGVGLWWSAGHPAPGLSVGSFWQGARWDLATLTVVCAALVGPLFSSDAWNNVTFTGAEVVNPKRNLPLALFAGTAIVSTLYFLCNWVYVRILPFAGSAGGAGPLERGITHAVEDRVATAAMQVVFGPAGTGLMAAAIVISTFGCNNGLTLAGARVYYAMAKDRLFFSSVAKVNRRYHTPAVSLLVQGVWASLLTLSGTYNQLLNYVIFSALLFYILTIAGLFRLRRTRPEWPRPYRAWGYPVLPAIYVAFALFVEGALLIEKVTRGQSLAGLGIVALGIPVYFIWRAKSRPTQDRLAG